MAGKLTIAQKGVDRFVSGPEMAWIHEAPVYIQLLRQNPATAYEIGSTGVPRPNTYNALKTLARRGRQQAAS